MRNSVMHVREWTGLVALVTLETGGFAPVTLVVACCHHARETPGSHTATLAKSSLSKIYSHKL